MLLSGTPIAEQIENEIKEKLKQGGKPHLAVIIVGTNPASHTYVEAKARACQKVGIQSTIERYPDTVSEETLLTKIEALNRNSNVHGILVQFPLPPHINTETIIQKIDPSKDVDGFHPINMGKLLLGIKTGFAPCTPLGIKVLLERYGIHTSGKHVVIVGRSNIVGKPLAALLMQKDKGANATVTIAHSQSEHLEKITHEADILVAAIGKPHFIIASMIKKGAVVIDVGINRIGNKIVGDVDFTSVQKKASAITPVPKGVGPMTVAMLLQNTYQSFEKRMSP